MSRFSVFLPKSRYYSVYFSYFRFFAVSPHIPCPTVFVSHFARFSVFLTIFHVLPCEFLIFHVFYCFLPYSRYYIVFLILHFFGVSHHIKGPTMWVSHFRCVSVSCHIPCPIMWVSHFSRFSMILAIFQVLRCWVSHFSRFSVFSPKYKSDSVYF